MYQGKILYLRYSCQLTTLVGMNLRLIAYVVSLLF